MLAYHAAYYRIEDGWYLIKLLDFPEVFTQGRNLQDARAMIRDALKTWAELYMEEGKPLPRPNPKARSKRALFIEPVYLTTCVTGANAHEMKKTA